MNATLVDATCSRRISGFARRVLRGGEITRGEAAWLFSLESSADIFDLMAGANRLREHFKGNKIHLCSIVNAKAGACSENCSFCAQSSFHQTDSPRYGFVDPDPVRQAAEEAGRNHVTAVGLVAAWRGLKEGPMLDEVCDRIRDLAKSGKTRPDASLGIIESQAVADRLKAAGLECYGHNLESSRQFFPRHCTTPHLRAPPQHHPLPQERRPENLFRRHHRHGRNPRGPLRTGLLPQGSRRQRRAHQHPQPHPRHALREQPAAAAHGES